MPNALRLWFEPDTDGTGELFAEVHSGGFAGVSSAWFDAGQLVAFARRLGSSFPLPSTEPLSIEGGFWSKSGSVIEQLHVGLKFYPIGSTGKVGCRVSLATHIHANQDRPESQSLVAVELNTKYEQLRNFSRALELLVTGHIDEVHLQVEG
ncbi:hypothetical protein [Rubrivivax benzoatilyticus]|uniref:Uncharacterized protein n=1 Tax=Rubrivivax benzoatilyticus TaxID=316997 RepID=A0ABX0HU43_9BURK|nr:hypothetical protein [Rubrivivax benzoatilyticus]NHK97302.1 hypothetical protein [Rubrivivax benzoatilyticus]NHL23003.1 hypothetical protein [Rubrivivax benzoatilyticus]